MAVSVEARIADLLLAHLADLTFMPPLPIAYPGVAFNPPEGAYLEATLIPNTNLNRGLGPNDSTQFRGIFQVTVVAPNNAGIIAPTEMAAKIADHFERGTLIADGALRVKIDGRPSLAPPISDTDRMSIPVSIRWHAFSK